ncbi:hypothetical protein TSACC_21707 [Terrimicrobium sacchariphilum]|uniref:Uncharacterized protein n=1 Tax=Terrimicrobium sacchariphilum TaxID=690879 RepID=A0A146G8T4_TERSA|nr:hypothetical protein [Terrimicrobium sacchariphilum]GAT33294.1 hypothetical protein TSACC_21707 [Terrimicrobium sacchariphilum]
MPYQLIPSFNAGEISPYLDARADLEKYASGCRLLENFIIMPYGGVFRRPGTEYLGTAKYSDKRCRLVGFNFSTTTRFVLELGNLYIRFWSNGYQVTSGGSPVEVVSPYLESELRDLQYVQINDVMYFVHPAHEPMKLTRVTDTNWTFASVAWDWPAFLDENVTATTITPSATTGTGITLTASAALFDWGHVGGYFQIAHARTNAAVALTSVTASGSSGGLAVLGSWDFTTYGTWVGVIQLQRSKDSGSTWETFRTFSVAGDRNITATGKETGESQLRITYTHTSGTLTARLEAIDAREYGVVKITAITDTTHATADVVNDLAGTGATKIWSEGAWSVKNGFPRTVALHEQRLWFAGTSGRPQSLWGSMIDDFENFRTSALDDSGLFFTLSAQESNVIQWLLSQKSLLIGTAGGEWTLGSTDSNAAITPANVKASQESSYGSKYLRALIVNDVVLFVQRQGRKVRELLYSNQTESMVAQDLTLLSEHVTKGEILETAFQQQPDAIYWTITGTGQLVGLTYERLQNVVGWHRHTTDGTFESVATTYGANGADEVWVAVKRTVNGQDVRYIERFRTDFRESFEAEDKENWWYLDSAKRVTLSPESASVTGLAHLEGRTVDILADGAVSPARTVSSGAITLQAPAGTVLVGLPFVSTLKPTKLEMTQYGTRGKTKRVHRINLSFHKSLGGLFSTNGSEFWDIVSRTTADAMDDSPPAFTGDKNLATGADHSASADIIIRQEQPLPLTILAITPKWDAYDDN